MTISSILPGLLDDQRDCGDMVDGGSVGHKANLLWVASACNSWEGAAKKDPGVELAWHREEGDAPMVAAN